LIGNALQTGILAALVVCAGTQMHAQATVTAHLRAEETHRSSHDTLPPAVLWLVPASGQIPNRPWPQPGPYTLLQKNRAFHPHLLVVPVGATVAFPNADPFFHNVFSLFDGKRFDLGLYEKGSSKTVLFDRLGVSYLFCNIHPMMSAVVLSLNTPLWSMAGATGELSISNLATGEYDVHLWIEGESGEKLDHWTHRITLHPGNNDLGEIAVTPSTGTAPHTNKFGQPYAPEASTY
jgi:hypothetical protein